uniref:Uncharacterized protein n=1 Tax=Anguilla anguilla TaxID=7936 RepID=A0A0E9U7S3_ANGAN
MIFLNSEWLHTHKAMGGAEELKQKWNEGLALLRVVFKLPAIKLVTQLRSQGLIEESRTGPRATR